MTWRYDVSPDVIGAIIEAVATGQSAKLGLPKKTDGIEVQFEGVPIARVVWEEDHKDHRIVALACHAGRHGVQDSRWDALGTKIELLGCSTVVECPLCSDLGWIPADSDIAKKQAILSGSMRVYRGVKYQPSREFTAFIEKAAPFALASLFT
jgi:hypothetical protein